MLRQFSILPLMVFAVQAAGPPQEVSLERYRALWSPSPFTSEVRELEPSPDNSMGNYVLGGVSMLDDGYYVILFDRRDSKRRIVIRPETAHSIEVVGVKWSEESPLDTIVTLREGKHRGTVSFDASFLRKAAKQDVRTSSIRPRSTPSPK